MPKIVVPRNPGLVKVPTCWTRLKEDFGKHFRAGRTILGGWRQWCALTANASRVTCEDGWWTPQGWARAIFEEVPRGYVDSQYTGLHPNQTLLSHKVRERIEAFSTEDQSHDMSVIVGTMCMLPWFGRLITRSSEPCYPTPYCKKRRGRSTRKEYRKQTSISHIRDRYARTARQCPLG